MQKRDIYNALDAYARHHMPNNHDLWPRIRQELRHQQRLSKMSSAMRRGVGALTGAISFTLVLLLLIMVTSQLARRTSNHSALQAPINSSATTNERYTPPTTLSPDEAADVTCFQGQLTLQGERAYVGHQRQILVAELTQGTAEHFLTAHNLATPRSPVALDPNTPVYFVIIRGTVTDRLGGAEQFLGTALAVIMDQRNHITYVGIDDLWNSIAPGNARDLAPRLAPRLTNVSIARAQGALGTTIADKLSVPANIALQSININRINTQVDPSGAYSSTASSVTSVYTDTSAEPQLWLSQATTPFEVSIATTANSIPVGSNIGHYYAWRQADTSLATLVWQDGDRWFCLTARLSASLTERDIVGTAVSVAPSPQH